MDVVEDGHCSGHDIQGRACWVTKIIHDALAMKQTSPLLIKSNKPDLKDSQAYAENRSV